jgi:sugar/nucleoside kinase (ribokinase family)/fructoselysine-6-P-deglycase FrlB-like protein
MVGTPVVGIGSLSRDIVYLQDETSGQTFRIGIRGGGSLWNALANASVNGAETHAICVGGGDAIARACVDDLRTSGVRVDKELLQRGKKTRTIHERLSMKSISIRRPKHEFEVRCPVCNVETYRSGTARITKEFMKDAYKILCGFSDRGMIIHTDGVDLTRLRTLKSFGRTTRILTLDLGRSTGIYRMHQTSLVERLRGIDVLFVHSKVLPELKRLTGSARERDLLGLLDASVLISTKGDKGVDFWVRDGDEIGEFSQPSAGPKKLVDTAGAGDALIGFFLSRLSAIPIEDARNFLEDAEKVASALSKAQVWAAHKCGFFGPRGHIAGADGKTWSWDQDSRHLEATGTVEELKLLNLSRTRCVSCEAKIVEAAQPSFSTLRFIQNVIRLPSKVESAWKTRMKYPWGGLWEQDKPGYVVGTGGSYSVAYFAALLLSEQYKTPVMPIRPFDFIRYGVQVPTAIFVSNSGKTIDVVRALEHALDLGIETRVFITGANPEIAASYLRPRKDLLLCTGADGERGFLSVAGTIVPCFMIQSSLSGQAWNEDSGYLKFHRLFESARVKATKAFSEMERRIPKDLVGKRVVILGGGFAWPAMLDIESKMVESGTGLPEISEMKDYSHGRFVSSIDSRSVTIVFGMPDDKPYRDFLIRKLGTGKPIIEISTELSKGEGALELMLQGEHFMKLIAERAGIDISAPKISPRGLQLYRYADILNFVQSPSRPSQDQRRDQ